MAGQIKILNTFIHNLSMEETLSLVNDTINNKESIHHVVVNAGKIVQMQKDKQLHESVNNSDIINACLLYTSPSPRDGLLSRMPSSA